jgi:hypothetical protein
MMCEEVYLASTVPGGPVMDMMMRVCKSSCGPAIRGLVHVRLEKASGPNGKGSQA